MTPFQEYISRVSTYTEVGRAHFFIGRERYHLSQEEAMRQLKELLNESLPKEKLKAALAEMV